MPQVVEAIAPATVANLGPGFDILGMALESPFDTVRAERTEAPGVVIDSIEGDGGRLTYQAEKNTAGVAAAYALKQIGAQGGVRLSIRKGLPLASGLGSSSASAVAGAVAVNALYGDPLQREDLLAACIEGEAAVSGRHADNVGPALLGGIVLITGLESSAIYRLPVPENLYLAMVTPAVAVPTAEARAVLPRSVPLNDMVRQTAGVALLVTAIHRGDIPLFGRAMELDRVVEPARQHLMPGLSEVRQAARDCGALGTIISGAGPTLCSVCDSGACAARVTGAMAAVYAGLGIGAATFVTRPSPHGASCRTLE
jgi:homoserine kinase